VGGLETPEVHVSLSVGMVPLSKVNQGKGNADGVFDLRDAYACMGLARSDQILRYIVDMNGLTDYLMICE